MKNVVLLTLSLLWAVQLTYGQQPYYNDVDLSLTGQDLYFELQSKIDISNNTFTYGDVRDALKITDEDPNNTNNVLLIYGYNDTDGNCTTDRTRDEDDFGGLSCEYNREHVFARSNANPDMGDVNNGTTGIGADPHNLRASDQQMNNNKGSKKFADGSGTAGNVGSGNWYPGDEWKGDVARMMMYMYTRYGDRCLPVLNGVGSTQGSSQMLQVFLEWNAEDPVSEYEDQRNPYLETAYGNRNPFIDNPYLATLIWGGPAAEDRWNLLSADAFVASEVILYPNPASEVIHIKATSAFQLSSVVLYDTMGRIVFQNNLNTQQTTISLASFAEGIYLLELQQQEKKVIKKIIVE
ncbi:endonuclease [Altibacter sp.]|uniref:endonuclease n=1 Tax=Altibacter sp. TaxID=2024823 RepID=UPI002583F8F0|nr:endonuclease [Altibacter sp.]MCW9037828.1 endonuclease [Altibacter sp.]